MQTYPQLGLDVVYYEGIFNNLSQNMRLIFNNFGGVPVIKQHWLSRDENEKLMTFLELRDVPTKLKYLEDSSFQVTLYKYFSKIKELIQSQQFAGPSFLRQHSQLKALFMDQFFEQSYEQTIQYFREQLLAQDSIYAEMLEARIREFQNGKSFTAICSPTESVYCKAVQYAQFAQNIEEQNSPSKFQLEQIYQRMLITKQPLLDIYKKSWFDDQGEVYSFLGVAQCSFNKTVDSFLRYPPEKQLSSLLDMQSSNTDSSQLINFLREHEYIVHAFCLLKIDNRGMPKPSILTKLETKINHATNSAWLEQTLNDLLKLNLTNSRPIQIAPDINQDFQIIGNGQPLKIGRKRNFQQSTIEPKKRTSHLQLVPIQPPTKRIKQESHNQNDQLTNIFDDIDGLSRNQQSKIWINQQMIELCLEISKQTNQKVFHFYGVKILNKFLDTEKGDYVCTQVVAWKSYAQQKSQVILGKQNKIIQDALFTQLQFLGHLVLHECSQSEAWRQYSSQLKEILDPNHINQSFVIFRNPIEDEFNDDLAKKEEFLRPATVGREIKWNDLVCCKNIIFESLLPFYFLNQEGEHPRTWFSANVSTTTKFKVVKLNNFWVSLLEGDEALYPLYSTAYFEIFSSQPLLDVIDVRNMKSSFQQDYHVNTEGSLMLFKLEKIEDDEDNQKYDQQNKFENLAHHSQFQSANIAHNLGSSLIDSQQEDQDQIISHSRNQIGAPQQFNQNHLDHNTPRFSKEKDVLYFTEKDFLEFKDQIVRMNHYQSRQNDQLFARDQNQQSAIEEILGPSQPFQDQSLIQESSDIQLQEALIDSAKFASSSGSKKTVLDNQEENKLPEPIIIPKKIYQDPNPAVQEILDKISDQIRAGYLSCSVCYNPCQSAVQWVACVNRKCCSLLCPSCIFDTKKLHNDKFRSTRIEDYLIWKCSHCTLAHPKDERLMQQRFVEIKRIFDREVQKDLNEMIEENAQSQLGNQQISQPANQSFGNHSAQSAQNQSALLQMPNVNVQINPDAFLIQINRSAISSINEVERSQQLNGSADQSLNRSNQQLQLANNSAPNLRGSQS